MPGFVDKFKRMWDAPEDEYEYDEYGYADEDEEDYEEPAPKTRERDRDRVQGMSSRNKVVNINATAKLQVAIFKPNVSVKKPVQLPMNLYIQIPLFLILRIPTKIWQEEFLIFSAVLHTQTTAKSRELPRIHISLFRAMLI